MAPCFAYDFGLHLFSLSLFLPLQLLQLLLSLLLSLFVLSLCGSWLCCLQSVEEVVHVQLKYKTLSFLPPPIWPSQDFLERDGGRGISYKQHRKPFFIHWPNIFSEISLSTKKTKFSWKLLSRIISQNRTAGHSMQSCEQKLFFGALPFQNLCILT